MCPNERYQQKDTEELHLKVENRFNLNTQKGF